MSFRASTSTIIGAMALVAVTVTSTVIAWRASKSTIEAGFWWEEALFALSLDDARKIGGPLGADELTRIRGTSRGEVERAYRDLRIAISDNRHGFWRVAVVADPIASRCLRCRSRA